jgi:hypothetical protein
MYCDSDGSHKSQVSYVLGIKSGREVEVEGEGSYGASGPLRSGDSVRMYEYEYCLSSLQIVYYSITMVSQKSFCLSMS